MSESKTEFVRRKKSEKRLQAERQVEQAFAQVEEFFFENEFGEKEPEKGVFHNDEFYPWRIKMEPEIENVYSTIDISKALKMPRERMREWMVRGFVKPSLPSTSKGTIAIFTRNDVLCVALFQRLIGIGLKREAAAEYVKLLANSGLVNSVRFITFIYKIVDGEPTIDSQMHTGDMDLNLNIDSTGNVNSGWKNLLSTMEWEGVHIINMMNLENVVDAELEKLG